MKRFALLLFLAPMLPAAASADGPRPPCAMVASPAAAAPGNAPAIAIYHAAEIHNWQPAPCIGWSATSASHSKLVVAVAGSFHFEGAIDRLLERVGAVSALSKVSYWSTTDKQWRPLAYAASALSGKDAASRRPDFSPSELVSGAKLHYWENDSRSGEVVTRLTVRERTSDHSVIATENITPIRRFLLTLFPPGSLQTVLFLRRVSPTIWEVYLLSRTSDQTSLLADGHEASYVNRAVALYRQIAGIRTDQEPPAAR